MQRQVPEPMLAAFNAAGWTYRIDFDYISELSKQLNMSCIGATNYSQKTIYISEASATLHEFGHFLDWTLGFPAEHEQLFRAEAAAAPLRNWAIRLSSVPLMRWGAWVPVSATMRKNWTCW